MAWVRKRTMPDHDQIDQTGEEIPVDNSEEDDFYGLLSHAIGETHTTPGASEKNSKTSGNSANAGQADLVDPAVEQLTPNAAQRKVDMQKKAAELRARLIANRQKTPAMVSSGASTPSNINEVPQVQHGLNLAEQKPSPEQKDPSSDIFGLKSLLAEGKAAAGAKLNQNIESALEEEPILLNDHMDDTTAGAAQNRDEQAASTPVLDAPTNNTEHVTFSPNLTDDYYTDLPIWLEITGYHDVDYRNSKLRTHKERKALEEEAARIVERLEKLRQDEQAEMASLRSSTTRVATVGPQTRPKLPSTMPAKPLAQTQRTQKQLPDARKASGTKRPHSPDPIAAEKAARLRQGPNYSNKQNGNESSATQASARSSIHSPPNAGLERRISYPEVRRNSIDVFKRPEAAKAQSRDPSLERRQKFYKHDSQSAAPALSYSKMNSYERNGYAGHQTNGGFDDRGRLGSRTTNRVASGPHYRNSPQYGRSASFDHRNDGVRYFMIKSWNHENVRAAMEENLWATQEKNEQILTEAYQTSKSVVLFFSVNKSTAFQGYAVMTSAPDPSLPKASFCAKLNWGTSAAFTLRWLAKTDVHYRHVGHLKNTMNPEEDGKPMAVLVGKDSQEISPDAGAGLAAVLDDYDSVEDRKSKRKRSSSAWSNSLSARW